MFLIAEKHMIKQGAVTWKKAARHFEGLCMPILRLLCHLLNLKTWGYLFLFFLPELNDEPYLSWYAEVSHDIETNRLEEGISWHFLLVPPVHSQIVPLNWSYLHDVAYVKATDPFRLIQKSQYVPHVKHLRHKVAHFLLFPVFPFLACSFDLVRVHSVSGSRRF